ncbi:hypothetical protein EMIHUDRAFT_219214 [Emiliania huxleyi CCMP1516]|uniref:L domain-like protein n=2 Tax=Emiliania huxleyi TaxID=2903 RepID=A0A0D3I524_EMIH1|nr:hypothetical protein EMIHUDRAFT_219214 [Emiliania huxleyi CCMP1516]EOD06359.1 hypothetical protein EMIHUDRAFT_219214 [Emiliania huxleyi CCMP1516]|eukprot:XP_005758788.1 hypothetical protein EMIHUDRAFT_219214 [Emiliania huxleyi CCMP1516]
MPRKRVSLIHIQLVLTAACSSSAPPLFPLTLLLLADRCEAAGTACDNNVPCSSGCPTGEYGTSLCDGTFTGTRVDLDNQELSGTIPPQLGDNSQLRELYLDGNAVSGTIPADMRRLWQLQNLYLHGNSISGTIPETDKWWQLKELYLYNNDISGTVPSQLKDLPLKYCKLGGTNQFACPLPALPDICISGSYYPTERIVYTEAVPGLSAVVVYRHPASGPAGSA